MIKQIEIQYLLGLYRWSLVTVSGVIVCSSNTLYKNKSNAKRSAENFKQHLKIQLLIVDETQ